MENYTVGKLLGKGGMGEVHLVSRTTDGAQFALKRTDFGSLSKAEKKATMLEVSLLSRLQHPYIGGITDHFHDGDDLCMVLELAGGGDLDKELRHARNTGERIPEARLLDVLNQVGSALHYMHSCRVIHRDMKPANGAHRTFDAVHGRARR
jgi:serine/threonine protein kinase